MADLVRGAHDVRIALLDASVALFVNAATERARRKFAIACAKLAMERAFAGDTSDDNAVLWQALAVSSPAADVVTAVKAIVDKLEADVSNLSDKRDEGQASDADYAALFKKARAANAVWYALHADPTVAAAESAFEAVAAVGDDSIVELAKRHPTT